MEASCARTKIERTDSVEARVHRSRSRKPALYVLSLAAMATVAVSLPDTKIVLYNVSWETYERLTDDLADTAAPRLTYDQGRLEIMSPTPEHERLNRTINLIVEIVAVDLDISSRSSARQRSSERASRAVSSRTRASMPPVRTGFGERSGSIYPPIQHRIWSSRSTSPAHRFPRCPSSPASGCRRCGATTGVRFAFRSSSVMTTFPRTEASRFPSLLLEFSRTFSPRARSGKKTAHVW